MCRIYKKYKIVDPQTNISIGEIFEQGFQYCKGGEQADHSGVVVWWLCTKRQVNQFFSCCVFVLKEYPSLKGLKVLLQCGIRICFQG